MKKNKVITYQRPLWLAFIYTFLMVYIGNSQETFPKNGVSDQLPNTFAITNATIIPAPGEVLKNATLLIRNKSIEKVVNGRSVPSGYTEINANGKYIYPSFIDAFSTYGQPEVKNSPRGNPYVKREQIQSNTKGSFNANEAIKSEYNASEHFLVDRNRAQQLRKQGFGLVATFRPDGVARGTASLVALGESNENQEMLQSKVAAHFSFHKGSSTQDFPISPMGSIALLRQTYYDTEWYNQFKNKPFMDQSLEAILNIKKLPQIFETNGWLSTLRAHKIAKEFNINYILKGGGDEYQRVDEIKALNATFIIPLNFPDAYDVSNPFDTEKISLTDLKHWELAPSNPARLEEHDVAFAITSHGQGKIDDFLSNLKKAVAYGLSPKQALYSLTVLPAKLLHQEDRIGTLESGKLANFIIISGEIFDKKTVIYENWVQGKKYIVVQEDDPLIIGTYSLSVDGENYSLVVEKAKKGYNAKLLDQSSTEIKTDFKLTGDIVTLQFNKDSESFYRLGGWINNDPEKMVLQGKGQRNDGKWIEWKATKPKEPLQNITNQHKETALQRKELGDVIFPFVAFGSPEKPVQQDILIKNATVWTNEKEGILTETDVLLKDGEIVQIGKNLKASIARIIDGTGKHLTAGIIDEHSHIALSAVNDIATVSAMIRMSDALDSERINIYRALAGGVVAAQILHGSSNPIGGQSAFIKLRWGEIPEGLKIKEAKPFIKFALGENPKRSKSVPSIRFPRSLMGLEQVYTDVFTQALAYKKDWQEFNALKKKDNTVKPRVDLANKALLEVVEGKRYISCHAYQQGEMLMLMNVAERFNFNINTFTHVLEGYRIADRMLKHGVGGSTFSDKWNFKWETRNAIPYNATVMHNEGVVTAINSDSQETIRHLNQEAAKSVKYGNMSEQDALKLVTLNPAQLLHLDDTMGSITVGKSADVVLWSENPLSIYAKAEKTIIEGIVYFDIEKDKQLRKGIQTERNRIISAMKNAIKTGSNVEPHISISKPDFTCEYLGVQN
ncbi:amidohydrolase family protein [Changchengzhania lutea]|uniref:amidohydrolase family protein n=1 Tax=Changchengzhania lutea TaxID=2049305 RepID=UPI00115E8D52|nr:amidohydrolase family protein [Changchengzhania lutea]